LKLSLGALEKRPLRLGAGLDLSVWLNNVASQAQTTGNRRIDVSRRSPSQKSDFAPFGRTHQQ